MNNVIETKHLTKYYGKVRGMEDVNLSIGEGEFFGFIGPNGAGKSSTIRTLLGLISPTSGEAYVYGKPLSKSQEYLGDIGYLASETIFYNTMKVDELIRYSAKLRRKDCEGEARKLCERLELDTRKRIDELSLGNRKKVGIVCALQHRPKLYIMDEPTSGLDPLMQKVFFELLHERQKEGATIFFSSHVLSEVQSHCSKAAIIRDGHLVAVGSMENLSKTNAKRVTLQGVTCVPESLKAKSVTVAEDTVSFLYQGDIKDLLQTASALPLKDMTITEPELEEIFLHYYEKEEQ